MKISRDSSPRLGSALVITLCILVLITSIVIAFFAQSLLSRQISFSSAGQERARLVALSALDNVQAALNAEMQAGSVSYTPAPSPNPAPSPVSPIMRPRSAKTMVPARMIPTSDTTDTTNCPNLIKYSAYGSSTPVPLWPANVNYPTPTPPALFPSRTPMPASAVATTTASANGRSINLTRWAKPSLNVAASHAPTYPAALTPYWVLMSRRGVVTNPATAGTTLADHSASNANYVIGRFGYVVYDEGGLIDVTAGGWYPSLSSGATPPVALALKGNQGYADLTQLGLNSAQSDTLVKWRNLASASSANKYQTYLSVFAPQYGFMRAAEGDNAFVGRQDFMQFWQKNITTQTDALQYFTTFSREKNAPSWGPYKDAYQLFGTTTLPSSSTAYGTSMLSPTSTSDGYVNTLANLGAPYTGEYAYAGNDVKYLSGTATNGSPPSLTPDYNRLFPGVRVTTAFTRLSGATAVVGEPLVKNRFDLSKLSWISNNSSKALPTGILQTDVYNYFGLKQGADGWSWTYGHGNPTSDPSHIMTLDEVSKAGREPDFFELLQAGILQGSLGFAPGDSSKASQPTGPGGFGGIYARLQNGDTFFGPVLRTDSSPGNLVDATESYQVIQIGANIIDQANTDGLPREIVLNGEHFYGVENMPYIHGLITAGFRPSPLATLLPNPLLRDQQEYIHCWTCCALWNPHQNALSSVNGVQKLRILGHKGDFYPFTNVIPNVSNYGPGAGKPATNQGPAWEVSNPWLSVNLADYVKGNSAKTINGINGDAFSEPTMIDYAFSSTTDNGGVGEAPQNADQKLYGRISSQCPPPTGSSTQPPAWTRAGLYMGWDRTPEGQNKLSQDMYYPPGPQHDVAVGTEGSFGTVINYTAPPTIYLQYLDPSPGGVWHTYEEVRGFYCSHAQAGDPFMEPGDPEWYTAWWGPPGNHKNVPGGANPNGFGPFLTPTQDIWTAEALDPRSLRQNMRDRAFNTPWSAFLEHDSNHRIDAQISSSHFLFANGASQYGAEYANNTLKDYFASSGNTTLAAADTIYTDNDFIPRPGDGGGWYGDPQQVGNLAARPVMLNRPFRNVGELGFVSRDSAWRTLDFSSAQSGDGALLDIFCVGPAPAGNLPPPDVVAGKMNLNSASATVLQALVVNAARTYTGNPVTADTSSAIAVADATKLATAVATYVKTTPMYSLGDLPLAFPAPSPAPANPSPVDSLNSNVFPGSKVKREAMVRALADSGGTRTWNLLIDVIAQSGRLKPGSASPATTSGQDNFVVEGEKRYWLHVAIDRFTGEVVDKQLEPVSEQ